MHCRALRISISTSMLLLAACPPVALDPVITDSSSGGGPGASTVLTTEPTSGSTSPLDTTEPLPTSGSTAPLDTTEALPSSTFDDTALATTGDTTEALTGDASTTTSVDDTTGTTDTSTGATTGTTGTGDDMQADCPETKCLVDLLPAEQIDAAPVHDIGLAWGIVAGGDDGLRVWHLLADTWTVKDFAPTPGPVRALVATYLQLGDIDDFAVAAICPEAGEMLVYRSVEGELTLVSSVPIPAGAVDVARGTLTPESFGDLLVLDGAKAQLLPFANDGDGNFTPRPAIGLQGQPVAVTGWSGAIGVDPVDSMLAVVAEPQGSSVLIVETKDVLPSDIDVVPVPNGPADLRVLHFSDVGDPAALVASETDGQLAVVSPESGGWEVFNTPSDGPARFDIGGNIPEAFALLAILHRATGTVSLAPFSNGEASTLEPPKWSATTIADPRRLLIVGKADIVVSSPTSGLAIHRAKFIDGN